MSSNPDFCHTLLTQDPYQILSWLLCEGRNPEEIPEQFSEVLSADLEFDPDLLAKFAKLGVSGYQVGFSYYPRVSLLDQLLACHVDGILNYALVEAILLRDFTAIRRILEAGADPNCFEGKPLLCAVTSMRPECVSMLLEAGAKADISGILVRITDIGMIDLLCDAAEFSPEEFEQAMIEHANRSWGTDLDGNLYLSKAHIDIVFELISMGLADPRCRNYLLYCMWAGHAKLFDQLIRAYPIDFAQHGKLIVKYLLDMTYAPWDRPDIQYLANRTEYLLHLGAQPAQELVEYAYGCWYHLVVIVLLRYGAKPIMDARFLLLYNRYIAAFSAFNRHLPGMVRHYIYSSRSGRFLTERNELIESKGPDFHREDYLELFYRRNKLLDKLSPRFYTRRSFVARLLGTPESRGLTARQIIPRLSTKILELYLNQEM